MSTINKKTHLYKWFIAAALGISILAAAQVTSADTLWKCVNGDRLESNTAGDNIADITNITASETVIGGWFKITDCTASGTKAVADGNSTTASGNYAVALGNCTTASGIASAAFGDHTTASGDYSAVFGHGYYDSGWYKARALKSGSFAATGGCVEHLYQADADGIGSVLLGGAVEGGEGDNAGYLRTTQTGAMLIGGCIGSTDGEMESNGKGSVKLGGYGYSTGGLIQAEGDGSLAGGHEREDNLIASGRGAFAWGWSGIHGGGNWNVSGNGAVGLGSSEEGLINATGNGSIALGGSHAAAGPELESTADGSVAIGNSIVADVKNAFALGKNFTNSTIDSVAVGFGQKDLEVWNGNVRVNGNLQVTGTMPDAPDEPNEIELFLPAEYTNDLNNYRAKAITTSSSLNFSFAVPYDFHSLVSVRLFAQIGATAAGANKDIDLDSDYGALAEAYNNHSESDHSRVYNFTGYSDKFYAFDANSVFTGISAGDYCGLTVKHNSIGGTLKYIGLIFRYKTNW